ncbi:hypothetical protein P364_0102265 [Paenibacillus sp. MAEPY2]|nr:hypothetical protein P364_0102265 [Paenibacillus sp. MAEPY2]KGP85820.1 hypothetical protein P363_0121025 [Paenibacillus sp. MAEPY1]
MAKDQLNAYLSVLLFEVKLQPMKDSLDYIHIPLADEQSGMGRVPQPCIFSAKLFCSQLTSSFLIIGFYGFDDEARTCN